MTTDPPFTISPKREQFLSTRTFWMRYRDQIPVSGYAVHFRDYPCFDFYVYPEGYQNWHVCEVSTGLALTPQCRTRKTAIPEALRQLGLLKGGRSQIRRVIQKQLRKNRRCALPKEMK